MRLSLALFFFSLAGLSFTQDTNFPQGPQYLIVNGSPIFSHSIATPTLAFSSTIPDPYNGTELAPSHIASLTTAPPNTFLDEVYWGERNPSEFMQPRISTPILTAEQTAFYTYATANAVTTALSAPPGRFARTSRRYPRHRDYFRADPRQLATKHLRSRRLRHRRSAVPTRPRIWGLSWRIRRPAACP